MTEAHRQVLKYLLLALQVVRGILLDARDAASYQFSIVHDMIRLQGKHSLDVVHSIAHDQTIPVLSVGRGGHLFELKTLHYRDGKEFGSFGLVIEYDPDERGISTGSNTSKTALVGMMVFLLERTLRKGRGGVHGCS